MEIILPEKVKKVRQLCYMILKKSILEAYNSDQWEKSAYTYMQLFNIGEQFLINMKKLRRQKFNSVFILCFINESELLYPFENDIPDKIKFKEQQDLSALIINRIAFNVKEMAAKKEKFVDYHAVDRIEAYINNNDVEIRENPAAKKLLENAIYEFYRFMCGVSDTEEYVKQPEAIIRRRMK